MAKLIWIDLETTGLDPDKHRILEVCAFESTVEDPFNVRELYHAVIGHNAMREEGTGDLPDDIVINMHAASGLWLACEQSTTTVQAPEDDLLALIGPLPDDYTERAVLAGSTPQFDRGFIRRWWPRVYKLFHHRHFDVSSVKLFARMLGMPKIEPRETHRAREDILESIDHARRCFDWCRALNVQPPVAA